MRIIPGESFEQENNIRQNRIKWNACMRTATDAKKLNTANCITACRFIFSIAILLCRIPSPQLFCIYSAAGITDILDGWVARRMKTETLFGSKLDTVADMVFVFACIIKFIPFFHLPDWTLFWIGLIGLIKISNIVYEWRTEKHFLAYHSGLNKIAGVLLFLLPFSILIDKLKICVLIDCGVATIASVQEWHHIRKRNTISYK